MILLQIPELLCLAQLLNLLHFQFVFVAERCFRPKAGYLGQSRVVFDPLILLDCEAEEVSAHSFA